jgi:DNA-binding CsgD family transcriptional regulator
MAIKVMEQGNTNPVVKNPVKLLRRKTRSLPLPPAGNKKVAELKHGIVLNLHFDGLQIVDLLKYLRQNSITENIKSIDPVINYSPGGLFLDGKETSSCIWIDDETYLTWREFEIMERLIKGLFNKEIADDLGLGNNTVRNHLHRIFTKLKVGNRSEAIIHYLKNRDKLKIVSNIQ